MKKLIALLIVLVMSVGLVACTGSASTSVAGSSASATGTPTIDAIKAKGKLIMLTNATFPPYEYFKDNKAQGVDVDLARLVADELGVELEVMDLDFDLLIDALKGGKGDIVAAGMTILPERSEQVDFTVPYVNTTLVIMVASDSDIKSAEDLAGKKIAVQESTTSDFHVTNDVEGATVLRFKSAVETGSALASGKADAVVMDEPTALSIQKATDKGFVILDENLTVEEYAMAIAKGQEDLMAVVNKVLQKAIDDKVVEDLFKMHMENME